MAIFERLILSDHQMLPGLRARGLLGAFDTPRDQARLGRHIVVRAPFLQGRGCAAAREQIGVQGLQERQEFDARDESV